MARNTMKKNFSLKDSLFNTESVSYLAQLLTDANGTFQKEKFIAEVMSKLQTLELKERIVWIAEALQKYLSKDFKEASAHIIMALPKPLDPTKTDNDFGSFIFAPFGEYVVQNGLSKENLSTAYETLLELTQRFSMEDAMRSYINTHPQQTLAVLKQWSTHDHYHVRRLVSETTRPLLPWSRRLSTEPTLAIPFLDTLYADRTRFVTRSVANHLNDIAKKDPNTVVSLLQKWKKEGKQDPQELAWMTRHALRTLVKKGNKDALRLLGYTHKPDIEIERFSLKRASKKIARDGTLSFSCTIAAHADVLLMIDYTIDFVKAKGNTRPKVFKIKKLAMKKGERIQIKKDHRFRADATTYRLHAGQHKVTLQINGKPLNTATFIIH